MTKRTVPSRAAAYAIDRRIASKLVCGVASHTALRVRGTASQSCSDYCTSLETQQNDMKMGESCVVILTMMLSGPGKGCKRT